MSARSFEPTTHDPAILNKSADVTASESPPTKARYRDIVMKAEQRRQHENQSKPLQPIPTAPASAWNLQYAHCRPRTQATAGIRRVNELQ